MNQVPDHTYLSQLLDCPRAWFHRYVENLEPKEESVRLVAGSSMHKGLAVLYENWEIERACDALAQEYASARPMGELEYLTTGHLQTVLRNYYDHWKDRDPFSVVAQIEEPVVEEIDGMMIGGIPDMIVDEDGELIVLDHKTSTNYLGAHLYNRVKFQKQFAIYCLLMSEKLGQPVRQAKCNAIYTGKDACTWKTKDGKPVKHAKWDRYSFEFAEEDLEETKWWLRCVRSLTDDYSVDEYFDWDNAWNLLGQEWPQHGGSHCGWCEYRSLCEVAPPLRDGIKSSRFRVREVKGVLLSGADQ